MFDRSKSWLGLLGVASLTLPSHAQVTEFSKLVPSDAEFLQSFGSAVAIEGDTLVVGAIGKDPRGAFYSYTRTGSTWGQEVRVDGPATGSIFGRPIALRGKTLVVGDTDDTNANGQSAGAAYIYEQAGTGWTFVQKLIGPNGTQFDNFSSGVAVAQDTIVVGAREANGISFGSGSAYVFERDGTSWSHVQTLFPSQGGVGMGFGGAVAIDDAANRIVVAAAGEDSQIAGDVGAVYVFERVGDGWIEEARLWDPTAPTFEFFGASISIDGSRLLIGATANDDMAPNSGAAWIYEYQGGSWTPIDKFHASDTFQDHRFGHHVRLKGDTAIVSGHLALPVDFQVYQFQRVETSWVEVAQLGSSDQANFDGFAETFDFDGGNVLVTGANGAYSGSIRSGAAYVHLLDVPSVPYCTAKLNSSGCLPLIGDSGTPTFTGPDDFMVEAISTLPSKPGLFFFGIQGPLAVPFFNGTLCVSPPLARTPIQQSSAGTGCSGTYGFLVSQAHMAGVGLYPGTTVHGQYWMRDPDHVDGTGVGLSNALEFSIRP